MPSPIAALEGRIAVGAVILNWEKFDINVQADEIPVRTFENIATVQGVTAAFEGRLPGFLSLSLDGGGYWDADANPHTNPPLIRAGQYLSPVYGYVRKTGTRRFTIASLLVLSVKVSADVTGSNKVMVNMSGKSSGIFYYPT